MEPLYPKKKINLMIYTIPKITQFKNNGMHVEDASHFWFIPLICGSYLLQIFYRTDMKYVKNHQINVHYDAIKQTFDVKARKGGGSETKSKLKFHSRNLIPMFKKLTSFPSLIRSHKDKHCLRRKKFKVIIIFNVCSIFQTYSAVLRNSQFACTFLSEIGQAPGYNSCPLLSSYILNFVSFRNYHFKGLLSGSRQHQTLNCIESAPPFCVHVPDPFTRNVTIYALRAIPSIPALLYKGRNWLIQDAVTEARRIFHLRASWENVEDLLENIASLCSSRLAKEDVLPPDDFIVIGKQGKTDVH
ncbi:hypothetical protein P5673_020023 [Acropora cervicornis]|uniref:Uncharacterized protein n=1 Tax=Acropora cervicornis TaxID=6130 RepID=A0AAD9QAC2_ACRCE|nr:hypothetical protein P5673_020023 [Acropora cervicornis]